MKSKQSRRTVPISRSQYAFAFGARTGVRRTLSPKHPLSSSHVAPPALWDLCPCGTRLSLGTKPCALGLCAFQIGTALQGGAAGTHESYCCTTLARRTIERGSNELCPKSGRRK